MVDAAVFLDDSRGISEANQLSEIRTDRFESSPLSTAKTTVFPFPVADGNGRGVTLTVIENLPALNGLSLDVTANVLALHLGRPVPIRQRREDVSHAWTLTRGDLNLVPAGWGITSWTENTIAFLQVELPPELMRQAAGQSDAPSDLPCLFSFSDPSVASSPCRCSPRPRCTASPRGCTSKRPRSCSHNAYWP